ncbi:hypothetical protein SynBIOSE41_03128 [Synechococcus sp. BIOS-E4-1]|nr:hypothetical protein [Synechococcus sp. BIOS-E4-1]QNI55611.1 hypothetical protein SynBIOSE41_03128 [Synechococcus sp. BIOS-E4-1]
MKEEKPRRHVGEVPTFKTMTFVERIGEPPKRGRQAPGEPPDRVM